MTGKKFLSIGECMVEFARSDKDNLWARSFAGDTFNTAWYFNNLSSSEWATEYFTCVGDDKASAELLDFIENAGIDTRHVAKLRGKSPGLYTIDLDGAERSFSYWRDSSAAKLLASDQELLKKAFGDAHEIYFSGITIAILSEQDRTVFLETISEARAAGAIVSFDPNIRPRLWDGDEDIRHWTHRAAAVATRVFPTHDDEAVLFSDTSLGDTAERYLALGAKEVVVKNGASPCLAVFGADRMEVGATTVESPVDTTGAGDSFNAGYLAARASGKGVREACAYAHGLSAKVIAHYGALIPQKMLGEL